MRQNCDLDLPWFSGGDPHNGSMVIVGGGPSVLSRMDALKIRQRNSETIVACNGANGLLRRYGVDPDIVVFVDPSEAVAGFICGDAATDGATYLISSICHPSVFEAAKGRMVFLWHPEIPGPQGVAQKMILDHYPYKPSSLIGGGCTGALRSLSLGYVLGFREFHMYGVDSSYPAGGNDHAYKKHDGPEPAAMSIEFDGKFYNCSPWMVRQADEFRFYHAQLSALGCSIIVHGFGLLPDMSKVLNKVKRTGVPFSAQMPATIN